MRRVLVAIEPVVLEGALAFLLERLDVDEVVRLHEASSESLAGDFDAAVVSDAFRDPARAKVTITLADLDRNDGSPFFTITVTHRSGTGSEVVDIREHPDAVIDLLDRHVPASAVRADRLREVRRTP